MYRYYHLRANKVRAWRRLARRKQLKESCKGCEYRKQWKLKFTMRQDVLKSWTFPLEGTKTSC